MEDKVLREIKKLKHCLNNGNKDQEILDLIESNYIELTNKIDTIKDYEIVCLSDDGGITRAEGKQIYDSTSDTISFRLFLNGVDVTNTHEIVRCPELPESLSNLEITGNALRYNVDARSSTFQGLETGGSSGRHRWVVEGDKNVIDLSVDGTLVTLNAMTNTDVIGDEITKSITGNSWNAAGYSTESFDPNIKDFAFSWEIESVDSQTREMGGLDDNPTERTSYSSMEYAIYQLGSRIYSRVYENGGQVFYGADIPLIVGDRVGIRVESGVVTYYLQRGNVITDFYTSTRPLTVPVQFKAALYRGTTSSGNSTVGNIKYHDSVKVERFSVSFEGGSADLVNEEDKEELRKEAGLFIESGSTYANWSFDRENIERYNGTSSFQLEINHSYIGMYDTSVETITFS